MLGVKVAPSDFFIPAFLYLAVDFWGLIGEVTCTGQLHALLIVPMFYPIRKGAVGPLGHLTLAITWPQGVHSQGSNPTEAAQVHGTVRCSLGLETVALEEVRLDTSDRAETRNSS